MTTAAETYRRIEAVLQAVLGPARRRHLPASDEPRQPRGFSGPCVECGAGDHFRGYTKRRCRGSCYEAWLYRTSQKRRDDMRRHTAAWVKNHPGQAREIQRRSQLAYDARQRAKRQQEQQP